MYKRKQAPFLRISYIYILHVYINPNIVLHLKAANSKFRSNHHHHRVYNNISVIKQATKEYQDHESAKNVMEIMAAVFLSIYPSYTENEYIYIYAYIYMKIPFPERNTRQSKEGLQCQSKFVPFGFGKQHLILDNIHTYL